MKNFPRKVHVSAATALAILSIVIVQACAHRMVSNGYGKSFELAFEKPQQLKDPETFCNQLQKDLSSSAIYNFEIVQDNGSAYSCCKPTDCSVKKLTVKVDRITTSQIAEASASELTPIGSHVTQRLYSDVPGDITLVLGLAKASSH